MSDVDFCQVSTTTDSRAAAQALAGSAVQARLAACAQIVGPVESTYRWAGKVETAEEYLVVFKTTTGVADALQGHIVARHSYEVPEVIRTPITGGAAAYLAWIVAQTSRPDRSE